MIFLARIARICLTTEFTEATEVICVADHLLKTADG
jgi:hypothetical protein